MKLLLPILILMMCGCTEKNSTGSFSNEMHKLIEEGHNLARKTYELGYVCGKQNIDCKPMLDTILDK